MSDEAHAPDQRTTICVECGRVVVEVDGRWWHSTSDERRFVRVGEGADDE